MEFLTIPCDDSEHESTTDVSLEYILYKYLNKLPIAKYKMCGIYVCDIIAFLIGVLLGAFACSGLV